MSVNYFSCNSCPETICDALPYFNCANCGDNICEDCYPRQKRRYGIGDNEQQYDYGDECLKECDNCSKKTLKKRIKIKEEELKKLKTLLN